MNNDLREKADTLLYGLEKCGHDRGYVLDNIINLIRTATLDEVKEAVIDAKIDRDSTPIHNTLKAIDNLRGNDDTKD